MKRERIAEINNWALEPANYPSLEPDTSEIAEIAALALRATDPEYILVPIADIIDVGKEPFKDGACEQCYPHKEFTKPGFHCVYHEAADKYRAHFQEDQP